MAKEEWIQHDSYSGKTTGLKRKYEAKGLIFLFQNPEAIKNNMTTE